MQSDFWGTISDQGIVTHITGGNFAQSSIMINGWLRDFLWAHASQVIQSYGSSLSAYGLFFLVAHFVWAFSLIFFSLAVMVISKNSLNLSLGLITN
jgi:photosystem I P700 chlorophyll a apoprotein A1